MNKILFENEDFLVVSKPNGISFNDEVDKTGFFTQLKLQYSGIHAIHRLDKVTSGLMIVAKSPESASIFGKLFTDHLVQKIYLAIASNKPTKKQGLIKGDMEKSRGGSWKLLKSIHNPAITQFFSYSLIPGKRIYVLKPSSGKTHQLRVALKSLGAAILGDQLYKGDDSDRVYLHAYALKFNFKGKDYSFKDEPTKGALYLSKEYQDFISNKNDLFELKWPKN